MISVQYILFQMCYWMLYCVGYSYVTLFLLGAGFKPGTIGLITAGFGTLAAILQPNLGRWADQNKKFGWKPLILVMSALCFVDMICLNVIQERSVQGILFGLFLTLLSCMLPFTNSANFYYESRGISVKFGFARGLGSLFYAILSYLIGVLTANGDTSYVPKCGVVVSICLFLVTLSFPYGDQFEDKHRVIEEIQENVSQKTNFLKKYPKFCMTLLGFVLFLLFHNIANTYLLQMIERVGGNSKDFGAAIALSAVLELPAMFGFVVLKKKFSMHFLLSFSAFSFAVKSIFYVFSGNVMMIYVTQIFQATAFALFIPASVYFADLVMEKEDKIKGQAWVTSSITVGAVLGNLIGGFWIDRFGVESMLVMTASVAVTGAFVVLFCTREKREE